MKKLTAYILIIIFHFFLVSCSSSSQPKEESNEELSSEISQLEDEIDESGEVGEDESEDVASEDSDDFFEDPSEEGEETAENEEDVEDDDFSDFEEEGEEVAEAPTEESLEPLEEEEASVEVAEEAVEEEPGEPVDPLTAEEREYKSAYSTPPVDITDISYLANESGGTVVIKVDSDFYFKTRSNIENKQFVVEVANANLPDKFKRPYLMKEFKGASFGALNAYQKSGSSIARVVLQLKGEKDPIVQKEGNTLLIIPATSEIPVAEEAEEDPNQKLKEAEGLQENVALEAEPRDDLDLNIDYSKGGTPEAYPKYEMAEETKNLLLNARTLEEFLLKHRKYYGKPISIQVDNTGVKDVLEMISEEAGLNLALPNELGGSISLKLRKVPWDQAFILILKSNGLGYVREGNVIRVDTLNKLGQEVQNAQAIIERRNIAEPLQIKIIPVSYLELNDAETKLKTLSTPDRGSVLSDSQTNSLIVTDVGDNILKMEKLLEALDIPPKQVLIEGKIIEAVESFSQGMGINWVATGNRTIVSETGGVGGSQLGLTPSLSVSPVSSNFGGIATLGIQVGTLDILGNLNAQIALLEDNNLAKVVSSPRVITLTGEAAKFSQTISVPFIQKKTTTDTATGPVTSEETGTQNFSIGFDVTPVITADDSIRLDLKVNRTNPASGATLNGQVTTSSSNAETKVLVGNNQTAVIGGIYAGSETQTVNKVPVLGDIPILGWLFKSKAKENTKTELVIFVTPRVISSNRIKNRKSPLARQVKDDTGLEADEADEGEETTGNSKSL